MNSSFILYSYLSTPISKSFLLSMFLFCTLQIKCWCHEIFELFLATTITALKPVSCDHVTSFNYDGKKTRDVGFAFICHLDNIKLESIFHESMGQEITCFLKKRNYEFCNIAVGFFFSYLIFFYLVIPLLFSSEKIYGIGFITITSLGVGKS